MTEIEVPKNHPRYLSLTYREKIIRGWKAGVVADAGLIAHGRGEAFDYMIGEKTNPFAAEAVRAAAARLLASRRPVISVNGNTAALDPEGLVRLSSVLGAPLEVNLFYRTSGREEAVREALLRAGAVRVLGVGSSASARIPELSSERRRVDPEGILKADTVFVPLEDGDRTEALVRMGKHVVTVDLNPLSRTARSAAVTIVDNFIRALPLLTAAVEDLRPDGRRSWEKILSGYRNPEVLAKAVRFMARYLKTASFRGDADGHATDR